MLPGRRTSAIAVALGQVIEWSPPRTIGIAPAAGDLEDLAVDQRVGALDPGRDDVGVAGVDDGEDLERLDIELERVDRARTCTAPRGWRAARSGRPVDG